MVTAAVEEMRNKLSSLLDTQNVGGEVEVVQCMLYIRTPIVYVACIVIL